MQILTWDTEADLINSGEPFAYLALGARPVNEMHAGHNYFLAQCKAKYPKHKRYVRIYTTQNRLYNSLLGYDPYSIPEIEIKFEDICGWAEAKGIDYISLVTWNDIKSFMPNFNKTFIATLLPLKNLDLDTGWDKAVTDADAIVTQDELCVHPTNQLYNMLIWYYVLAACLDVSHFPVRCMSEKDGYYNYARKYIWDTYVQNSEYALLPTLKDVNGIHIDYDNQGGTKVLEADWHTEKEVKPLTPKWLNGKTCYVTDLKLDNGMVVPHERII